MTDFRALAMYKRGSYPGQIDHPGWLSMVVHDAAALEAALADGWSTTMTTPAPAEPDPPVFVRVKKSKTDKTD